VLEFTSVDLAPGSATAFEKATAATSEQALPEAVRRLVAKSIVEIWTLRPTMSPGLALPTRP
jgi:hypothetical protein